MADRSGSYRNPKVSHRTIVMRKAADDDARRIADREEAERRKSEEEAKARPAGRSTRVTAAKNRSQGRTVSGRTVVIKHEGEGSKRLTVSTRESGPASVRVTGGDTIIRYQSGDMVVMRGARRAELRKQLIWGYALGYLILFGLYFYFLLTGTTTITPEGFLDKAFAMRHSASVIDLEHAALEAMRGNRTPAEVRLAQPLSFYDENRSLIRVAAGDRLTLPAAAKLGRAIIEDQKLAPPRRTLDKPIRLYKETYLANMNWPHWLTLYNAFGFFLLVILFLWRPIREYLGTQGKKTAVAIRNAREAQETAAELRDKYRQLAAAIDETREQMTKDAEKLSAVEREAALAKAREQADAIAGSIQAAIDAQAADAKTRLGAEAAREACARARTLLEKRLGQKEHDAAVDELIADIAAARL